MKRLKRELLGAAECRVCGAAPETLLNAASAAGIAVEDVCRRDAVTLCLTVRERDLPALEDLARRCMCDLEQAEIRGGSRERALLRRRKALLLSALVLFSLLALSSFFIWDIQVDCPAGVSEGAVLRVLSEYGVDVGSFRPGIDMELVRNRVLLSMPELAWITVNVRGSSARVQVLARTEKPEIVDENAAADVVAGKSGVIVRMSVLNGQALAEPGQTVAAGELLVSGTMESIGGETRFVRAAAEITADTWVELSALVPEKLPEKSPAGRSRSRFALIVGKKRINFYGKSGKDVDGCDKIISVTKLGAEGLFALPLRLVRERIVPWESTGTREADAEAAQRFLSAYLRENCRGEVREERCTCAPGEGVTVVTLYACCRENIARTEERTAQP